MKHGHPLKNGVYDSSKNSLTTWKPGTFFFLELSQIPVKHCSCNLKSNKKMQNSGHRTVFFLQNTVCGPAAHTIDFLKNGHKETLNSLSMSKLYPTLIFQSCEFTKKICYQGKKISKSKSNAMVQYQILKKRRPQNTKILCPRQTKLGHYLDTHVKLNWETLLRRHEKHMQMTLQCIKPYGNQGSMHVSIRKVYR